MAEITMPRLSDTMSEGTVGRWLKKPGDTVERDEVIAEIETDKATMELVAFESGTLQKILIPEGQTVPIGEVIAIVGDGAVDAADATSAPAGGGDSADPQSQPVATETASPTEEGGAEAVPRTTEEARQQTPQEPSTQGNQAGATQQATKEIADSETYAGPNIDEPSGNGQTDGRVKASPLARRLAEEYGINLNTVQGTGPGGRILKENVEEARSKGATAPAPAAQAPAPAAQAPSPAPAAPAPAQAPKPAAPAPAAPAPAGEVVPMSRMRRAIARAMTDSKPGVPHIYITVEIDMGQAMALRKQINESGASEVKISVNDMVIKAAAKALTKFPALNSSFAMGGDNQPGTITHGQINVSVAVATDNGLLAPVVRDADKKSISAISAEIRELAGRAREGKARPADLEGATFQVSNLGMFDVVEFVSIITVPQAGSLSVGAVRPTPVVRDGQVTVSEIMNVTLSVDHRVADGAVAAQYLQELTRLLQNPMSLLV